MVLVIEDRFTCSVLRRRRDREHTEGKGNGGQVLLSPALSHGGRRGGRKRVPATARRETARPPAGIRSGPIWCRDVHRQQLERVHEPDGAIQHRQPVVEEVTRLASPQDAGAIGMQTGGVVAALLNHRLRRWEPSGFKGEALDRTGAARCWHRTPGCRRPVRRRNHPLPIRHGGARLCSRPIASPA